MSNGPLRGRWIDCWEWESLRDYSAAIFARPKTFPSPRLYTKNILMHTVITKQRRVQHTRIDGGREVILENQSCALQTLVKCKFWVALGHFTTQRDGQQPQLKWELTLHDFIYWHFISFSLWWNAFRALHDLEKVQTNIYSTTFSSSRKSYEVTHDHY
jgi:hypothetical protein